MTADNALEPAAPEPTRNEKGHFIKGKSGNPLGRPKGTKNHITELKRGLEAAVREGLKPKDVQSIISVLVKEAKAGNVQAAKLILDKTISNASVDEDVSDGSQGIKIVVENATFGAIQSNNSKSPPIEGEIVEE